MKNTVLLTLFFLSFSLFVRAQDTQAALAVGEQAIADFFAFDADAFGAAFANDGWLINPYGMRMNGRAEISQIHNMLFEQHWQGQNGSATVLEKTANALSDHVVVVSYRVDTEVKKADGSFTQQMEVVLSAVLRAEPEGWKINQMQITPIRTPGQG